MHRLFAPLAGPAFLRRIALAALISNVGIIITGGAVRLTGSGPRLSHLASMHRRLLHGHSDAALADDVRTFVVSVVS